jgi:hypothetical protein
MVYNTELVSPSNSWVVLTTAHDGIHVSRSGDKSAPRDQFNYIYEVHTFIPGKSDFAQNYTRLKVSLRCYNDLQNAYMLSGDSVDLGTYVSKKDAFPVTRSMDQILLWSYRLCQPTFELIDYKGYLKKYNMLSLQQLDSSKETLSIVIHSAKTIQCQTNTKVEHKFTLRAVIKEHKNRDVRFKVSILCEGQIGKRELDLESIDDIRNMRKAIAYTGILKTVKVPKGMLSIPNTYLDVDLGKMKEFAKITKNTIAVNARYDVDQPGLYQFTYKVYDIPSFLLLGVKTAIVDVRSDGPN